MRISLWTLALLCVTMMASIARADTVYSYTSTPYGNCFGTYCSGGPYSLSVTFDVMAGTQLDNLTLFSPGSDITADISSFSITDANGLSIAYSVAGKGGFAFNIGTDSNGAIQTWYIYAIDCPTPVSECPDPSGNSSYATTGNIQIPGVISHAWDESNQGVLPGLVTLLGPYYNYDSNYGYNNMYGSGSGGAWEMVTTAPEPRAPVLLCIGLLGILALAARSGRHVPAD